MSRLKRGFCLEEDIQNIIDKLEELEEYPKRIENENGTAIKFADGTMICYFSKSVSTNFVSNGSGYVSDIINPFVFPVEFIESPSVTASVCDSGDTAYGSIGAIRRNAQGIQRIVLVRLRNTTDATRLHYTAIRQMEINI